jgi:hypothetical protein
MDGRDYVGPTAVRAVVLPARAAYVVADGSEEGLRRAVQEACTRWGGMTEPVIPVRPGGEVDAWWHQVVSLARVDAVVNVDADPDDASAAAGKLGLELVSLADIDRAGRPVETNGEILLSWQTDPHITDAVVSYTLVVVIAAGSQAPTLRPDHSTWPPRWTPSEACWACRSSPLRQPDIPACWAGCEVSGRSR